MGVEDRDYIIGKHPPFCTCTDCTNKRLGRNDNTTYTHDNNCNCVDCVNKRVHKYVPPVPPKPTFRLPPQIPPDQSNKHTYTWGKFFISLLLALSFIGIFVIGYYAFSHKLNPLIGCITFLTNLVIYIILSIITRKPRYKYLKPGSVLILFCLIIIVIVMSFTGIQPFANYKDNIFKHKESKSELITTPTSTLTTTNAIINSTTSTTINSVLSTIQNNTTITTTTTPTTTRTTSITSTLINTTINQTTGKYKNYQLGLAGVSGNGCYDDVGNFVILINNTEAVNPTYNQLINFLKTDTTDQYPYTYNLPLTNWYYGTAESKVNLINIQNIIDGKIVPDSPKICADFAERLHNNAELAGIKCGYVSIDLEGYTDTYNLGISANTSHALCAFQTTDNGLVYIDCTGTITNEISNRDKIVDVVIGKDYIPISIFPEVGWSPVWQNMGIVTNIDITWNGKWNSYNGG